MSEVKHILRVHVNDPRMGRTYQYDLGYADRAIAQEQASFVVINGLCINNGANAGMQFIPVHRIHEAILLLDVPEARLQEIKSSVYYHEP